MSRLTPLTRPDLDAAQIEVWDSLIENRRSGGELVGADGALIGPFNAFVHAPEVGRHLSALGALLRFGTSLERRLSEVAICTVGAHWRSEFEFWAHSRMAVEHGVDESVVAALREGRRPDFPRDDERIVHAVVTELLHRHRVGPDTYQAARELLGERGLVELVATTGYYCLISLTLNLFDVRLPDDEPQSWPDA